MAIFTPSPLVGAISGNVAGCNFAITRYGPVIRKRLIRTDKLTERQLARRTRFRLELSIWQDMTDLERASWDAAAKTLTWPNRLGIPRHLTGFQLWLKHMIPMNPAPPYAYPAVGAAFTTQAPSNVVLTASAGGAIQIEFDSNLTWPGGLASLFGSRPVSSARRKWFSRWRGFYWMPVDDGHNVRNVTPEWDAALGHPREGEYIAIRFSQHRYGFRSPLVRAAATVAA